MSRSGNRAAVGLRSAVPNLRRYGKAQVGRAADATRRGLNCQVALWVWTIEQKFPLWSGTVVTAGDVAFYGRMDRYVFVLSEQQATQ